METQVQELLRVVLEPGRHFASTADFNAHPEFLDKSVYEVFLEERESLIPFAVEFVGWNAARSGGIEVSFADYDSDR